MSHWTYAAFGAEDDLEQGDLVRRTPELLDVLAEAHKHFLDEKYSAFIVLTQSCDMARRGGPACKSRYINLAVVRPLDDMLLQLLDAECKRVVIRKDPLEGVYLTESRFRAEQLLSRIIHQNEQGQGLFYLHPDADAGIAVPSLALLQVSIALRRDHYKTLLQARIGRLRPEFQSRLGWLIGNLYSRVATRDWDTDQGKQIIDSALLPHGLPNGPYWVSGESVREARKQKLVTAGKSTAELAETISAMRPVPPMQAAVDRTAKVVKDVIQGVSEQDIETIKNRLVNDQLYELAFRRVE